MKLHRTTKLIMDQTDALIAGCRGIYACKEPAARVLAPKMMGPTQALWAIEDGIRSTPLAVVRHLAAIAGSVTAGILGTIDRSADVEVGIMIAMALLMLSFGCSLSHLRDPNQTVPKGLLAFLGIGALVLSVKGVLFTFLAFAVISAVFFIRDIAEWCCKSKSAASAEFIHDQDGLFDCGLFTDEELYDIGGGPGPAITAFGLAK